MQSNHPRGPPMQETHSQLHDTVLATRAHDAAGRVSDYKYKQTMFNSKQARNNEQWNNKLLLINK